STSPWLELVGGGKQAEVDVSEVDAVQVRPGMKATVTTDAYPNKSWRGTVTSVAPYATVSTTGSGQVEVDVRLPAQFPVPYNYQVNVNMVSATRKRVPVVPYDALVQRGDAYVVFLYRQGRVQERSVTLGITGNTTVEVRSGVHPGDKIVLNPPASLHSGEVVNAHA
ncbi:MAG: HlyD family efflux transporter periplasmic adaptor subunit, partial [Alicyclobacillus sp.]|nr:HlyD family efflux transporter periplasmic adaptor subunit [Alicyclobacillus sp.]